MDAIPPSRPPHYGDNEIYGWSMRDCARGLIGTLSSWVRQPLAFRGDANGRVWHFQGDHDKRAQFLFESDQGHGTIELSIDASNWVRVEVFVGGKLTLRAWMDDPFEEKEFWPDGITPPDGDAPGRISKRGSWLQIRSALFPGVPDKGQGYWSLQDTFD